MADSIKMLGNLFFARLILAPYWMYKELEERASLSNTSNTLRQNEDPRMAILHFVDEGKTLRTRCEGGSPPPVEAIEHWRNRVKTWLGSNNFETLVGEWDVFPGKSSLDPSVILGFSGLINSNAKPWWDGINVRVLRLRELVRRL